MLQSIKPSVMRLKQFIERNLPSFLCGNGRDFRNRDALLHAQRIERLGQNLRRAAQQRDQQMPGFRRGLGHSV